MQNGILEYLIADNVGVISQRRSGRNGLQRPNRFQFTFLRKEKFQELNHAVELLFGGRGGPDLIRTGSDQARVDGLFHLDDPAILKTRGLDLRLPDGTLLLTRELARNGRSRVLVND